MEIQLRAGTVIGRDHLLMGKNRQDAFRIGKRADGDSILYAGVLSDGCGSTPYAEMGANLTASYLLSELLRSPTVCLLPRVSLALIHLQHFLRSLSLSFQDPEEFVATHLLATVLGFVTDGEEVLVFSKGDGQIYWAEEQQLIDEDNTPDYVAYKCLSPNQLTGPEPRLLSFQLSKVKHLAIASDGFEPELINEFWGKDHPNGVQRLLNSYSRKKHFRDDATLIILEQLGGE